MDYHILNLAYVVAAVLFIFCLKMMAHPRTAVRGNMMGMGGMLIAVLTACIYVASEQAADARLLWVYIFLGLVAGSVVGAVLAMKTITEDMPQLVALFNGFGGAASVLVASAELFKISTAWGMPVEVLLAIALSGLIGAVTFWGSLVAYCKLAEFKWYKKPFDVPYHNVINGCLAGVILLLILVMLLSGTELQWASILCFIWIGLFASVLGVLLTNPIGGADMPVVIALLNSYSGLAAAATGFVLPNNVLIISGSLVGASGLILCSLMCKAMNRSLFNVLFGVMKAGTVADADEVYKSVRSTTADDLAMILDTAQRVVFVPGYGMAVAQAQHAVRDLGNMLEENGTTVEYAIHPVAGRMPGHMNVLLAEADIDYEKLKEMDQINPTMETVDVAIVIGANDVVNPVARTDPDSPIAGMPIINVDKARMVIVVKRSLSPGFAGIPNPLFALENTYMLFGDGQKVILDVIAAVKEN